ncbi:MAG TPA: FixH family protein [Chitinophagaceae bacterium]
MNWGYKLMFVFIAFGGFMGFMVYSCIQTPISLVSAEYYKDELNYQQVIDGKNRANKLKEQVTITQDEEHVQLQLPTGTDQLSPEGKVWFYCVNDGKKDRKFQLETNTENLQRFAMSDLRPGRYIVKVDWNAQGNNYYSEKEIIIP